LQHLEQIKKWSKKSTTSLAVRQMALLCAGFDCLVAGGRMVYSTCSLSRVENEELVEGFFGKREAAFEMVDDPALEKIKSLDLALEKAKHGQYILPDANSGSGPIYFAIIGKRAASLEQ
jgi:16S rRNA C967 or C1407 C5-methylase (RsmB/RsmF family)